MQIALDAMGGDHAPGPIVAGAVQAVAADTSLAGEALPASADFGVIIITLLTSLALMKRVLSSEVRSARINVLTPPASLCAVATLRAAARLICTLPHAGDLSAPPIIAPMSLMPFACADGRRLFPSATQLVGSKNRPALEA